MKHPEIRKDYIQDKYVIIAPKRGTRPHDVEPPERVTAAMPKDCFFCPKNLAQACKLITTRRPKGSKNWSIAVIKNKFPSVSLDNYKAYGTQEVVIETPDHIAEVEELTDSQVAEIFEVYAERTKDISKNKKIEYLLIFKNNGGQAGASLQHAHSQIFAT